VPRNVPPAGAITATFVAPLDVLKTRLQLQRLGSLSQGGIFGEPVPTCLTLAARSRCLRCG
jgi:hypothetical protein